MANATPKSSQDYQSYAVSSCENTSVPTRTRTNGTQSVPHAPARGFVLLGRDSEREIEFRLRQLSRRQLISPEELDDIRQELIGALMKNSARFDPKRSSKRTFLCAVIQKQLRHILSHRKSDAEKCDRPVKSLEAMLESEQPVYNDTRQGELSETDRIDLQRDVQSIMESFHLRQRKICRLLMENQTPQRIAANLGLEEKILKREIDLIREIFTNAGYGPD